MSDNWDNTQPHTNPTKAGNLQRPFQLRIHPLFISCRKVQEGLQTCHVIEVFSLPLLLSSLLFFEMPLGKRAVSLWNNLRNSHFLSPWGKTVCCTEAIRNLHYEFWNSNPLLTFIQWNKEDKERSTWYIDKFFLIKLHSIWIEYFHLKFIFPTFYYEKSQTYSKVERILH